VLSRAGHMYLAGTCHCTLDRACFGAPGICTLRANVVVLRPGVLSRAGNLLLHLAGTCRCTSGRACCRAPSTCTLRAPAVAPRATALPQCPIPVDWHALMRLLA
jgi:hypothetical protein